MIRFFEIVREQILADADAQYQAFRREIEKRPLSETKKAEAFRAKFAEIQATLKAYCDIAREIDNVLLGASVS